MSTSALDSIWATSGDRTKADKRSPSTQYTTELQPKKDTPSEPSSTPPAKAGTSTLDSRWATSYDTFKSAHGLPATKFSESLAQRRADLHPEESDQPLTLIDDQEDRTARDWRSNDDRTGRGYNSFGRSSYNGATSPSQWNNDSYPSRRSFQDRDRSSGLSADATPFYPDSPRRQQRQSPQPSQYEPISARPWNMIALKKKLPSPSSETSTEAHSPKTEGRQSWSGSGSRSSWSEERNSASWTTSNREESANADKPRANDAWNEPIAKELSIPVAPVVSYKVTTTSVSRNPSTEDLVQSAAASQAPWNDEQVNNDATTTAADNSASNWNAGGSSTWDPSNVPWGNETTSPTPTRKTEQSTKRYTWSTSADQVSELHNTTQPYSITISLRSQPSENRNTLVSTLPALEPTGNQETPSDNNTSTTISNYSAQPAQEARDPVKETTWNSKPEPSTAQRSNRNTWGPTESWQAHGQPAFEQKQAARVEPPPTSWSISQDQNRNVPQKSHQQTTTSSQKGENHRADDTEYVLPPNTSCRPWDVDKYKHRLWEQ